MIKKSQFGGFTVQHERGSQLYGCTCHETEKSKIKSLQTDIKASGFDDLCLTCLMVF